MKVLCFGSLNIDYTYQVDHFVKKGETLSSTDLRLFAGGKGLNQSIALARAGLNVSLAGAIGEDGRFLLFAAEGGKNRIFVCDPVSGDWHAEDDPFPVAGCARLGGTVVCLAPASDGTSFFARRKHAPASLSGWGRTPLPRREEAPCRWFAETGPLTAPDPNCVFRRLTLRVSLPGDAVLTLEAKAGAFGKWRRLGAVRAKREGTLSFRSRTEPADALFLRLSGVGDCRVHALTLIAEAAGEVTDRG